MAGAASKSEGVWVAGRNRGTSMTVQQVGQCRSLIVSSHHCSGADNLTTVYRIAWIRVHFAALNDWQPETGKWT